MLALSENTLRVKNNAWRSVLENRVDVPWEQVRCIVHALVRRGNIVVLDTNNGSNGRRLEQHRERCPARHRAMWS